MQRKIELFHKQMCPHSATVRRFIASHHLESQVKYHDIDDDTWSEGKLLKLTGKKQVPCLFVENEEPILESDAIVQWLDTNLVKRNPRAA